MFTTADGTSVPPQVGMKVKIRSTIKNWREYYPLNIDACEWTLIYWWCNKDKCWMLFNYCVVPGTNVCLYLFSHVSFLSLVPTEQHKHKTYPMVVARTEPPSPMEYFKILQHKAKEGDNDIYSMEYLNRFYETLKIAKSTQSDANVQNTKDTSKSKHNK